MNAQSIYHKGFIAMQKEKKILKRFSLTENITVLPWSAKTFFFFWTPREKKLTMQKILQILKNFLIPDKFLERVTKFHN